MFRQLLTLIAVITGLAATGTPAHAISANVETVHLTQEQVACQAPAQATAARGIADIRLNENARDKFCQRPIVTIAVPSVMLRADRARE